MTEDVRDIRNIYKAKAGQLKPRGYYVDRIERLADEVLPAVAAWREGEYPVVFDHCFRRIAYDTACGMKWTEAVDRPFSRRAPVWLLTTTLEILYQMVVSPAKTHRFNDQSLQYREHAPGFDPR